MHGSCGIGFGKFGKCVWTFVWQVLQMCVYVWESALVHALEGAVGFIAGLELRIYTCFENVCVDARLQP